jgi:hypothetical protein
MIGIDVNEQEHVVRSFVDRHEILYPVGLDPNGSIADTFDVSSLPTTVVIGTDGRVKLYETGSISNAEVAFNYMIYEQPQEGVDNPRITPDGYRELYAQQGHPRGRRFEREPEQAELSGRALELAGKIRCPSCDDSLVSCSGETASKIKNRLAAMDLTELSDEEILAELFLIDGGAGD